MKRKFIKYLTDARRSAVLLLIAAFMTVVVALLTQESDALRHWLYGSHRSITGYILKTVLLILWLYPTFNLLHTTYFNNEWKKMLSILIGLLILFFTTAGIVTCLTG